MAELISVTEYAQINQKDVGNVRRLLAQGRINGIKIGNQWAIPAGTPYPLDKRLISGEYIKQRNIRNFKRNKALSQSIDKMVSELVEIFSDKVAMAVLYGSYARGTQTDESDVDIALIVYDINKELTKNMVECVSKYELETDKVLSVIDIDYGKYQNWKSVMPFYRNIEKEGIVLWKKN